MARPKRRKLKFDEESVNNLLQEVYNDSHNIKAKITRLLTKWEVRIKDNGDIAALGEQVIKLIGAEAKNQDQKIMLLKYLKEVVYNKTKTSDDEETKEITSQDRNALIRMAQQELLKKGNN